MIKLEELPKTFSSREELYAFVASISPGVYEAAASPIGGGADAAEERLAAIEPLAYARTRNFLDGKVTRLSPYIRHGILTLNRVRNEALRRASSPERIEKFIQELAWRDFWQRIYRAHPEWIWQDVEPYKTGFSASDYADELPGDISRGETGVAFLDQVIRELILTGYMHNHARMYVASYVVHWRQVKWQAGARWFLHHLLDGDPASNNLSWQWVASTFSNKPYIFNLENVQRYAGAAYDTSPERNRELDASYEELSRRLFPKRSASDD
jgi:deoxyribodipyrimidine photo-lyase